MSADDRDRGAEELEAILAAIDPDYAEAGHDAGTCGRLFGRSAVECQRAAGHRGAHQSYRS